VWFLVHGSEVSEVKSGIPYHALPHAESDEQEESEVTDVWVVKLKSEEMDVEQLADEHGYEVQKQMRVLDKTFLMKEKEGRRRGVFANLSTSAHVEWAEQQVNRKRYTRAFFSDPHFKDQWHVNDEERDLNVLKVWKSGYMGGGCQVAIVDDGLAHDNPDLSGYYNQEGSWDFNYGDSDPDADRSGDTHGTSAAGCAAANGNNGVCGVGTAPKASLAGIRLISKMASDNDEAEALSYEYNLNDVYSNSWGPSDDGRTMEGPGKVLTQHLLDAIEHGRSGKGTVYVWAGGNGREYKDNGNMDGYNNKPYTISIGAYGYDMKQAYYSEDCACLHAVAPSSGLTGPDIVTTYMHNAYGDSCRSNFGGTSAAAPMVSGVMCLLLGKYPDLTWREVQHVIVNSAQPIDEDGGSWRTNGAGRKFSHAYGFGRIDAAKMLEIAPDYHGMPELVFIDSGAVTVGKTTTATSFTPDETVVSTSIIVEHVSLYISVSGVSRGSLTVTLTSPSGMESRLVESSNDYHTGMAWTMSSNAHWGEDSKGPWKVTFGNPRGSTMTVTGYQLLIDGHYD